jgi:hypothetical protein
VARDESEGDRSKRRDQQSAIECSIGPMDHVRLLMSLPRRETPRSMTRISRA